MSGAANRVRTVTTVSALTVVGLMSAVPLAFAAGSGAPFKDSNIDGSLTFCSRAGTPITSGSLVAAPFVWKAVASSPAPAAFRGSTGRATLTAYQPLKYVDPGDWSGSQLTGSSAFTNPSHPVTQSTNGDEPLLNFVQAYPPHWQGLVEIRMIFTGADLPQHIAPYPAAVVKVTGNSWKLVSGGGGSCSAGQGVSDESKLLPKHRLSHPQTIVVGASTGPTSAAHPGTASGGSSATSPGGSHPTGPMANAADSTGLGGGEKAGIGLGAVAVVGAVVAAASWWRRRGVQAP